MILSAILGGMGAAKMIKSAWYKVKAPVKRIAKPVAAAAGTIGTYTAASALSTALSTKLQGGSLPTIGAASGSLPALSGVPGRAGTGIQSVMPDVLDSSLMRVFYRAPKGYVVVKDPSTGSVMAVRKDVAKAYKLWKPARKPPISAGDWHKYQTAKNVEKKLLKIARPAMRHHSSGKKTTAQKGKK